MLSCILALSLVTASWAYFTSSSAIGNDLQTNSYGVKTVEEFVPLTPLEPGVNVKKEVGVTNTGDYDLVVRIKFDEVWSRAGTPFKTIAFNDPALMSVTYSATPSPTYTAIQADATDGVAAAADQSVVHKALNLGSDWARGSDGYYYYTKKLVAGDDTGALLSTLTLASNADIGKYADTLYYSTVAPGLGTDAPDASYSWTTTKPANEKDITYIKSERDLTPGLAGYANADYKLTVTTEVVQATQGAVDASWTMTAADLASIKTAWALS